jgi:hypothetical protein
MFIQYASDVFNLGKNDEKILLYMSIQRYQINVYTILIKKICGLTFFMKINNNNNFNHINSLFVLYIVYCTVSLY